MNSRSFLMASCLSVLTAFSVQAEETTSAAKEDSAAPTEISGGIAVKVTNFESSKGNVMFRVYSGKDNWLGDDMVFNEIYALADIYRDGAITLELELPDGEYAFSIIHDENGNRKLDTNFIGIPKEPGVVSNSAPAKFGPPKYDDAKFQVEGEILRMELEF